MKFRYKKIALGIIRPIIPIGLEHNNIYVHTEVLVDSGADRCIFDSQLGEIIGLEVDKGRLDLVEGISGKPEPYYTHTINIMVGGYKYTIQAGFKPNYQWSYGIVGQRGFFDLFVVNFDYRKEQIELKVKNDIK